MTILIVLAVITGLLLWYAMRGRDWLKTKPWAEKFFALIEPAEIFLFKKSQAILVGRLLWFGGGLVTVYDSIAVFASSLDLTPITTRVLSSVPEDMRGLVVSSIFGLIGLVINWLRKRTTKPIELVAVPDKVVAENPALAQAVATADAAKTEAIAVTAVAVADAKAA